jgi:hypothetical protein
MSRVTQITNINVSQINILGSQTPGWVNLTPDQADKDLEKALVNAFAAKWLAAYPSVLLPGGNQEFGYMGPYSALQGNTIPPCVVQQITTDFSNWNICTESGVAQKITQTIIANLVSSGGQAMAMSGQTFCGPNTKILWLVLAGLGNTTDVVYVFGGVEQVDI